MQTYFPEVYEAMDASVRTQLEKIDIKTGTAQPGDGLAEVAPGENYDFIDTASSAVVLQDLWGNPEGAPILGMVFPREFSPLHSDSWGVTLEYDMMGHVSDKDAARIDFDELLTLMKKDAAARQRRASESGL